MDKDYRQMIEEQRKDSERCWFTAKLWLIAGSLALALYYLITLC